MREFWVYIQKKCNQVVFFLHTDMIIAAIFTIAKTGNQLKCLSTDEWIKKCIYIYVYIYICIHIVGYYSDIKTDGSLLFATWMDWGTLCQVK
jgi:hypothetical protein